MTKKMWDGRFAKATDLAVNAYNSSIAFDARMYRQDIRGSQAHARMLGSIGILTAQDVEAIVTGLSQIGTDIEAGRLAFDPNAEDIHMFIEAELTARIGDAGKRLHTGRSRNDQVALDLRLYLRDEVKVIRESVLQLYGVLLDLAEQNTETILPGYTHSATCPAIPCSTSSFGQATPISRCSPCRKTAASAAWTAYPRCPSHTCGLVQAL